MAPDRVHPDSGVAASAPPPPGAYYSVKDQPLPPPATYRGHRRRSPCCCCLLWLCSILTMLVVIIGIAALVFWLVVRPKAPKFEVDNVHISGLVFSASSLTVSPETSFDVQARNPNKKIGIYYDRIQVNVQTMGLTIGEGHLPTFYQGHKNTTTIHGDLISQPITFDQATANALLTAQSDRRVPLKVNVDVRARVKVGSWKSPKFTVKVRCDIDVDLQRTAGSQVVDKNCKVKR